MKSRQVQQQPTPNNQGKTYGFWWSFVHAYKLRPPPLREFRSRQDKTPHPPSHIHKCMRNAKSETMSWHTGAHIFGTKNILADTTQVFPFECEVQTSSQPPQPTHCQLLLERFPAILQISATRLWIWILLQGGVCFCYYASPQVSSIGKPRMGV